ncbi:MAG: alpha-L-fucosidase, partial [Candidatus Aminicenantes bacterium]|nr:alpha-L-fucosidase [Candidatus Aminicenantes bacterium]
MSIKFSMVCSVMKAASLVSLLLFVVFAQAAIPQESEAQKETSMKWWTEARFGMFIHWGLYAQAARHEWVKNREHIKDEDYQKYFDVFN